MKNEPIKVGLLTHGGGAHISAYLQALAAATSCSSVVLADPDGRWEADCRRVLGGKFLRSYRDHKRLLSKEQPGMSLVSMEARLAPPVIAAALEANSHTFAEKPACVRVADFAPLVQRADSQHRFLMLALANRLNPEIIAARKLIAEKKLGRIFGVEMHLIADQTRLTRPAYHQQWFAKKSRAGGGHLVWLGIHWLDLAMHLTASSVTRVGGFTANVGGQPIDVEDSAVATMQFDNGALGTLTSGYYLDRGYHSHIKIWGSDGWLHLEPTNEQPLKWSFFKGDQAGKVQTWDGDRQPRGYTPFVQAAVKAAATMADPPISNADSLRALKTVFGIYESAEKGEVVELQV